MESFAGLSLDVSSPTPATQRERSPRWLALKKVSRGYYVTTIFGRDRYCVEQGEPQRRPIKMRDTESATNVPDMQS